MPLRLIRTEELLSIARVVEIAPKLGPSLLDVEAFGFGFVHVIGCEELEREKGREPDELSSHVFSIGTLTLLADSRSQGNQKATPCQDDREVFLHNAARFPFVGEIRSSPSLCAAEVPYPES